MASATYKEDLLCVGTWGTASNTSLATKRNPQGTSNPVKHQCAYHASILGPGTDTTPKKPLETGTMERFLREDASVQSCIFVRPGTSNLNITKNCTCGRKEKR